MKLRLSAAIFALLLVFCACDNTSSDFAIRFAEAVTPIQQEYRPDKSIAILDAAMEPDDQQWKLIGETTSPRAYEAIVALADSLLDDNYQNELVLLPDPALGDSTFALVSVSVAPLRGNPGHSAEQVDQTIMGHELRLLKKQRGWYLAQTDYDYLGWISSTAIQRMDETGITQWKNSRPGRIVDLFPMMYSQKSSDSEPVCDLVLNCQVRVLDESSRWTKVATPDGRQGYVVSGVINREPPAFEGENDIILTARGMMGIPYLWGGNSSKGNDCSGFTQTVFRKNGISLPRDARQQAMAGEEVLPDEDFSNVKPGDLLFFGAAERITHVGISLGGTEYIHQGGRVDINSFDPESPRYSPYRHRTLKNIKRLMTSNDKN